MYEGAAPLQTSGGSRPIAEFMTSEMEEPDRMAGLLCQNTEDARFASPPIQQCVAKRLNVGLTYHAPRSKCDVRAVADSSHQKYSFLWPFLAANRERDDACERSAAIDEPDRWSVHVLHGGSIALRRIAHDCADELAGPGRGSTQYTV